MSNIQDNYATADDSKENAILPATLSDALLTDLNVVNLVFRRQRKPFRIVIEFSDGGLQSIKPPFRGHWRVFGNPINRCSKINSNRKTGGTSLPAMKGETEPISAR